MGFKLPWSNFHEMNLDWILAMMKELEQAVADIQASATPSTSVPQMDGVGAVGTESNFARGDHVHPTDTSRASASALADLDSREYNDYTTLNAELNTVDAKIAFSSAAPQVDGVASPGSSPYQARADHVHPTDTSRASQTQVDSLQATVDAFSGSANPYADDPEMDGEASPGNVAAYARGNHVHPSDTSRLATTGGEITGDLQVDGVLLQTGYNAYAETQATGWLRVAEVPRVPGTVVEILINKHGAANQPAEYHNISLVILRSTVIFVNEGSWGDALHVNKIRYTDAERLDVHVDQTALMDIEVKVFPAAPALAELAAIKAITPEFVNDAPEGETVLKEYTFLDNTERQYSIQYGGKSWSFRRKGNVVMMSTEGNLGVDIAAGTHTITTLPVGWRPSTTITAKILNSLTYNTTRVQISGNGPVSFINDEAVYANDPCAIIAMWIV